MTGYGGSGGDGGQPMSDQTQRQRDAQTPSDARGSGEATRANSPTFDAAPDLRGQPGRAAGAPDGAARRPNGEVQGGERPEGKGELPNPRGQAGDSQPKTEGDETKQDVPEKQPTPNDKRPERTPEDQNTKQRLTGHDAHSGEPPGREPQRQDMNREQRKPDAKARLLERYRGMESPKELTEVKGRGDFHVRLESETAKALARLQEAARKAGFHAPLFEPAGPRSGFRTQADQQAIYDNSLRKSKDANEARQFAGRPGHSIHETGRAVDLWLGQSPNRANIDALRNSEAWSWLNQNAIDFGFAPYAKEPWHWEYIPPQQRQVKKEAH